MAGLRAAQVDGENVAEELILLTAAALALSIAGPALADQPPGHHEQGHQEGYEGRPGNQNPGGH